MRLIAAITITAVSVLYMFGTAAAGGMFGPPQPASRGAGGLHTAVGYLYYSDKFKGGADHVIRQNRLYSEAGYGAHERWEMYGRIGIADLKIADVFRPASDATVSSRSDFTGNWKFFGTLGAKAYYPLSGVFGIGAFVQGTSAFGDCKDSVSGTRNGAPFTTELTLKDMWDVNFGIGLQMNVPQGIRLYAGPCIYYSEAKAAASPGIPGLALAGGDTTIRNKTNAGGFAGVDIPLGKGFRLNAEGWFSERLSVGTAVTYIY